MHRKSFPAFLFLAVITAFFTASIEKNSNTAISEYKRPPAIGCVPDRTLLNPDSLQENIGPLPGTGIHRWNPGFQSDSAAFYFNQGLNLYYGFHIPEAMASFGKVKKLEPENALSFWAMALVYGPNINDMGYTASPEALRSAKNAQKRAMGQTDLVYDLAEAMMTRYPQNSKQTQKNGNLQYVQAMKKLYTKYPDTDDVAVLYVDALMQLKPWKYWQPNGQPDPNTITALEALQTVLARNPDHPGAHHYRIHLLEASPQPEKAMASAQKLPGLTPGMAHMVHMPSHIYIRTGYYQQGVNVNNDALAAFEQYKILFPGAAGNAPLYALHNLHMKAACAMNLSEYAFALRAAEELSEQIDTSFLSLPAPLGNYVQYLYMTKLMTHVRYEQWQEVNSFPKPSKKQLMASGLYHWARGMAAVEQNQSLTEALQHAKEIEKIIANPNVQMAMDPFNKASDQLRVAVWLLKAMIFSKEMKKPEAGKAWLKAMQAEDSLAYNEPRDWLVPVRYFYAKQAMRASDWVLAEKLAREDMAQNPKNAHSIKQLQEIFEKTGQWRALETLNGQLKEAAQ